MKHLIAIFLFLSTSLLAEIGEISAINGNANIFREGRSIPVTMNTKIEEKDTIKTEKNTKLQIIFKDNTIISLGQKSTFVVEEYLYTNKKVSARFNVKGLFKSITGKIGHIAPKNFKLKTQNATIGVRGTTIIGESSMEGDTIICSSGQIIVSTTQGDMLVNMGQKTIVEPGKSPTKPTIVPKKIIQKAEKNISLSTKTKSSLASKEVPLLEKEDAIKEIAHIKTKKEDWGKWDTIDAIDTEPKKETPTPRPIPKKDLEELSLLREKAGTKTPSYHGKVDGFVNTINNKITNGTINLQVDLGRGKVDGDLGFKQNSHIWRADIKDGSVDRHGALDFKISNENNLQGTGDGMLSGEHLEHANGSFTIKDTTNNQNAYGTFKAGR